MSTLTQFLLGGSSSGSGSVPIGSYAAFSSNLPSVIQYAGGEEYLRSGVLAKATDYPTVPSTFLNYLNPLVKVADIGSGGMWRALVVDTGLGLPVAVSAGYGNSITIIGSSNPNTSADRVTFTGTASHLDGAGHTAVHAVKAIMHKGRLAIAFDPTKSAYSGSCPVWSYTSDSSHSAVLQAGVTLPTGALISAMASNSGGNMVAIRGQGTNQMWYASTVNGTVTAGTMSAAANWTAATFGSGLFVAVASGSTVASSSADGITWTARTLPTSANWSAVAHNGASRFVAVASGSTSAAYSDNGTAWTAATLPSSQQWSAVAHNGAGQWCAIARNSNVAATSADGITWTQQTLPAVAGWCDIKWVPGFNSWLAIADDGRAAATYSADGITWAAKPLPRVLNFGNLVSAGGSTLYALGRPGAGGGGGETYAGGQFFVAKSTDNGLTWTYGFPDIHVGLSSSAPQILRFINGRFVALDKAGTNSTRIWVSTDGYTWTQNDRTTSSDPSTYQDIAWNGTNYCFVAANINAGSGNDTIVWTSPDLITWTARTLSLGSSGYTSWRVEAAGSVFILCASTGFPVHSIARSTDNGVTWTTIITNASSNGAGDIYYDAARQIVSVISPSAASISRSSGDFGATWYNPSTTVYPTNAELAPYVRQGGSGTWVSYGSTIVHQLTTRLGGTPTLVYNHGLSLNSNKNRMGSQPFVGVGVQPTVHGASTFYIDNNSIYACDTSLYIDNTRAGVETSGVSGGTSTNTLNYYMRVK